MADPVVLQLTRLRVKNFRSIRDLDLELGPLTVLVGPNGSGKSNVVDALRFVRDCFSIGLEQALLDRGGLAAVRFWTAGGRAADVALGVCLADETGENSAEYSFTLAAAKGNGFRIKREELVVKVPGEQVAKVALDASGLATTRGGKKKLQKTELLAQKIVPIRLIGPMSLDMQFDRMMSSGKEEERRWRVHERIAWPMQTVLTRMLFYALNLTDLRAPQKLVQENPFKEDGQNLAAVLQHLLRNKARATELRQTLRRLVVGCVDISVETTGSFLVTYLHYQDASGKNRKSDLGLESDGTIRALGALAALFQNNQNSGSREMKPKPFLALEEPETNIHPGMLGVLAELFAEASTGGKQILLTTHSPDLLDFLPPESFRVVEKVDGETRVGALANSQIEIVRQHLFTPGELLRAEGLHRQPAPAETAPDQPAPAA